MYHTTNPFLTKKTKINSSVYSYIILGTTFIIVCIWRMFVEPYYDDFNYMTVPDSTDSDYFWGFHGKHIENLNDVIKASGNHWLSVNGRFANILTFIFLYMPRWLSSTLIAGFFCGSLWLSCYWVNKDRRLSCTWIISFLILFYVLFFPFIDHMTSTCFYLNYGGSGFFAILYVVLFYSDSTSEGARRKISLILISFIAGWMHEQFGIALCGASLSIILIDKENRKKRLLMFWSVVAGTALSALAPSTLMRLLPDPTKDSIYNPPLSVGVLWYFFPYILYLSIIIIIWIKKGYNLARIQLRKDLFLLTASLIALTIMFIIGIGARLFWSSHAMITLAIVGSAYNNFSYLQRPLKGFALIMALISCFILSSVAYYQFRISRFEKEVLAQAQKYKRPIIFVDPEITNDIPWYTMNMIQTYSNGDEKILPYLTMGKSSVDIKTIFVPPLYKNKDYTEWDKIKGKNDFYGKYPLLVSEKRQKPGTTLYLTCGKSSPAKTLVSRLRTLACGTPEKGEAIIISSKPTIDSKNNIIYSTTLYIPGTLRDREVLRIDTVK